MATLDELTLTAIVKRPILDRLLFIASKPKRRADLISAIHTSDFIEPSLLRPLTGVPTVEAVRSQLTALGATRDCYVISALRQIDGKVISLTAGLEAALGNTVETVLFCTESRVGFYEGGHPSDRYIIMAI